MVIRQYIKLKIFHFDLFLNNQTCLNEKHKRLTTNIKIFKRFSKFSNIGLLFNIFINIEL